MLIYRGGSDDRSKNTFLGSDDDSGAGLNASYQLWAEANTTYTVLLNCYSSSTRLGTYSYRIYEGTRSSSAENASSNDNVDKKPADLEDKLTQATSGD